MATLRDVVSSAMVRTGAIASGETPSAADAATALEVLTDMAAAWSARNIHTGWTATNLEDEFPLEDRHLGGVKAMLALELCDHFRIAPTAILVRDARDGMARLQADYWSIEYEGASPSLRSNISATGYER